MLFNVNANTAPILNPKLASSTKIVAILLLILKTLPSTVNPYFKVLIILLYCSVIDAAVFLFGINLIPHF
jgi:hypothetical protein